MLTVTYRQPKNADIRRKDNHTDNIGFIAERRPVKPCSEEEFKRYEAQMKSMFGNKPLPAVVSKGRILERSFLRRSAI